jgi:hypothetical protein
LQRHFRFLPRGSQSRFYFWDPRIETIHSPTTCVGTKWVFPPPFGPGKIRKGRASAQHLGVCGLLRSSRPGFVPRPLYGVYVEALCGCMKRMCKLTT